VLTLTQNRRSKTLLVAVVSVAIPTTLMVVAIAGNLMGQTRQDAVVSSSAARQVAAAAKAASGYANSAQPSALAVAESTPGMKLLVAAAAAGQKMSYQGVEMIARSTMTGTSTVLSTISHSSGGATVTETTQAAAPTAAGTQLSYDPYENLPEGVFGVTEPLVTLLATNYVAVLKGNGTVAGRAARVVELHRMNGQLAARFWLDEQTGLPLRREDYDTQSQLITEATFIEVRYGDVQASPSPATPASTGWNGVAVPATLVSTLRTKGWPLPAVLPGGLSLYAGAVSDAGAVDLSYSDGLFEVSLFVQRGILSAKLAGWQTAKIGGHSVLISARGVTWSASGYVYTVVSDASPDVVTEAVVALPHDTPPGFWSRLGLGLHRLGHMVDPFR
jgi:sigma-E factor negative regulatory protein RseB